MTPRELPILFNGEMARALLDGRKTQTRRPIKPQPLWEEDPSLCADGAWSGRYRFLDSHGEIDVDVDERRSSYSPGDLLYVREAFNYSSDEDLLPEENHRWCPERVGHAAQNVVWRADGERTHPTLGKALWRPSVHMPKWAARIWLRVTDVRVERVQDITEEDARAEGVSFGRITDGFTGEIDRDAAEAFEAIWSATYGHDSWDRNDWVWVYTFERVERVEGSAP